MDKSKYVFAFILLSLGVLFFSGCSSNDMALKRAIDASEMMVRQITAEETCCYIYSENLTNRQYISEYDFTCCKNTSDETACYKCILDKREEQRQQNIIAQQNAAEYNRSNVWKNILYYGLMIIFLLLFILLIVDKLLMVSREKGILTKAWRIALWILVVVVVIYFVFMRGSNFW